MNPAPQNMNPAPQIMNPALQNMNPALQNRNPALDRYADNQTVTKYKNLNHHQKAEKRTKKYN